MLVFNQKQLEAVKHKDGPMLVIAGPGCGKTAVLTGRLQNLINIGVSPSSILVVTFTRAAAVQMKERFLQLEEKEGRKVTFGTFHGIFYHILARENNLRSDNILGEDEKLKIIRYLLEKYSDDEITENELAKEIIREISYIKGNGIEPANYYSASVPADLFSEIYNRYMKWLQMNRKLDFDDITAAAFKLLHTQKAVLEKYRSMFRYILIDEFQDINPLQYKIMKLLAEPLNNIFVVGDDDQSIYRFRGSDPSIMLEFPKEYNDCRIASLSQNYRSTPQILDAAAKVINENKRRYKKKLYTENIAGEKVQIKEFDDIWSETDALSEIIRKKHDVGVQYSNIAVLVRTNFGARAVIERMISDCIPFEARYDIPCVFDHFIAKDLISYLSLASDSRRREDALRICNKPNRFISRNAFYEKNFSFEQLYIYYEDKSWMLDRVEELEEIIKILRDLAPYGAISYIRKAAGYDRYIKEYAFERKISFDDLMGIADEIQESSRRFNTLKEWKEHIDCYREEIKNKNKRPNENNSVKIETLHGSKGREYDIVYLLDVNEGVIPYHKARIEQDIEEERRLLYVGMTRAKKELGIFSVRERYEKKMKRSSFLDVLYND